MEKGVTLEKIQKEMESLTAQDQLKLVERLAHKLRKTALARERELDWSKLYGLGKGYGKGKMLNSMLID